MQRRRQSPGGVVRGADEAEGGRPAAELDAVQGRTDHPGSAQKPPERFAERAERSLPLRAQEVQILLRHQLGRILPGNDLKNLRR